MFYVFEKEVTNGIRRRIKVFGVEEFTGGGLGFVIYEGGEIIMSPDIKTVEKLVEIITREVLLAMVENEDKSQTPAGETSEKEK